MGANVWSKRDWLPWARKSLRAEGFEVARTRERPMVVGEVHEAFAAEAGDDAADEIARRR
jgi:hypothetical protein